MLRTLSLLITEDTAGAEKLFENALALTEDTAAVVAEENDGVLKVAAASTNTAVPFGGVTTARVLFIAFDQDISIKLNGGSQSIQLKKGTASRGVFYLEGTVTGVMIDNAGATEARVLYAVAGV